MIEAPPPPEPAYEAPRPFRLRVLFVSAEVHTQGHIYRCVYNASAVEMAGHDTRIVDLHDVNPEIIEWADVMILWRVAYSRHVEIMIAIARGKATKTHVFFDIDDLIFRPELARVAVIDGIRTGSQSGHDEAHWAEWFAQEQQTLVRCDGSFAPTRELAREMTAFRSMACVLPNIFSHRQLCVARASVRTRALLPPDGLFRIGYATGTRTHQRDFQLVLPALVAVLSDFAHVRLVLFREARDNRPLIATDEFPELLPFERQIEWRTSVPFDDLPNEMVRFDVSIAPLEIGNPFCESKSEIKFTEAALCDVPCIASPTGPFRRVIEHGVTGFLAEDAAGWETALRALIADPERGRAMGRAARRFVMWHFSPDRQARTFHVLLGGLASERSAAAAAEMILARETAAPWRAPVVPDARVLYVYDKLGVARISVVLTSFNYAPLVVEALDSVAAQTETYLDLVVVDDGSSDGSQDRIVAWCMQNRTRFNRIIVLQSVHNAGLGGARNIGMDQIETPYAMHLDADNWLLPDACAKLAAAMDAQHAAYAYPTIRLVGGAQIACLGERRVDPLGFGGGNSIDAMAMIAKWAWLAVGGYYVRRDAMGWEDYDLWCSFAERGLHGVHVPETLAEYRVHDASMTNTVTETAAHKKRVVEHVTGRHRWVSLFDEAARQRTL